MPLDPYLAKALLDWSLGGATPTRPVGRFIGFASGSPTTANDSAAPVPRKTVTFQAASTGAGVGSATLSAAMTGAATAVSTILGWNLYDGTTASTRLMYGTITSSQTLLSGSTIAFTAPNLKIVLS